VNYRICLFLISLWFVLGFNACKQSDQSTPADQSTTISTDPEVSLLIAKGKNYQTASVDSLLPTVKKLQQISNKTGNKTALLYAKLFNAQYLYLSSDDKHAMEMALDVLSYAEKWKMNAVVPTIYNLIANIHKQNTNYKMAFATAEKGLSIATAMHDTADIIALLGLQGMFTHSLWLSQNKRTVDNSLDYQLKALKIAESSPKYEKLRIRFYDNLAQYYKDNNDFAKAISYGDKSVPLAKKHTQERSLTYVYTWLGEAYYREGNHPKGLAYLDSALQTAYKIKEPYREMEIYMSMYDCALLSSNYKQAIDYSTKFRQLHDSLQVSLNEKQIGELQIKYETAKKDKQILLLDHAETVKSRQIMWILAGSCLFIIFIIMLLVQSRTIHRNNQIIKANNNQLNESLSSIAYIQSHELRKPLASILGLVNVIKADDYHVDRDILSKLEEAANDLDKKIQNINTHTQAKK